MSRWKAVARAAAAALVACATAAACDRNDEVRPEEVEQDRGPVPDTVPAGDSPDTTLPDPPAPSGIDDGEWHFAVKDHANARVSALTRISTDWMASETSRVFAGYQGALSGAALKGGSMATRRTSSRRSRGRRYSEGASRSVEGAMRRRKRGTLRSGPGGRGGRVKSRKQAIAIGLSEARRKGAKVPSRGRGRTRGRRGAAGRGRGSSGRSRRTRRS
jgi:hypothetical protein